MKALLVRHLLVLASALGQLRRRPVSLVLTLTGIGVVLCLPLLLQALQSNLDRAFVALPGQPAFTVYLEPSLEAALQDELGARIGAMPGVGAVIRVGRDEGLRSFLETTGLDGLEALLGENPLPDVLEVVLDEAVDHAALDHLGGWLESLPGVDAVQYDLAWKERLDAIRDLVRRSVSVFWVLLLAGVGLVIGNSVRLGLVTAGAEIEVIAMVGGSGAYIRRPYLYQGLLQGVAGAVLAILLARLTWWQLAPPVSRLIGSYTAAAEVAFIPAGQLAWFVALAGAIGWGAALGTVNWYLRRALPS